MQTISLILLPWIVYGILSFYGWFGSTINVVLAFAVEALYFMILYTLSVLFDVEEDDRETALERAKKIIG